ncbi:hypothetical protein TWF132_010117 [Orbilia oligospora]|nr:hypothetical protein TWF132_010117 [Orbilia oligospora]
MDRLNDNKGFTDTLRKLRIGLLDDVYIGGIDIGSSNIKYLVSDLVDIFGCIAYLELALDRDPVQDQDQDRGPTPAPKLVCQRHVLVSEPAPTSDKHRIFLLHMPHPMPSWTLDGLAYATTDTHLMYQTGGFPDVDIEAKRKDI